ncbi:MAG: glycosyltransferase family 4 protein [Bacteroidales bacterium]|nr:glycosyltransferase family 4 protein [Bacteroidales bacterium]
MKILMFNNEFPPLGGGTGTVNLELFNIFRNTPDLHIDLISSSGNKNKELQQFSENIRIFKLPVKKKEIHHASNFELIRYALKASFAGFKLHKKEKYDLVFVWTTVPAGLPAFFLKIFKKIPFIVRVGGPDIPGFEERYSFIYKIISPFIKSVWRKSEIIIAKCKTEKDMIKAINPKLKIKIIYNGVDTEKFIPAEKQPTDTLRIICPARLIKRKGQYTLIEAISNLKKEGIKIKVELIGEGDEKEAYIKFAKEKGVSDQIVFSGYIPRKNMPNKYQNANVFVLPSYNEGMSNALLEAMACGLPVVVTNVGGTKELVDESNGFIFNPGDVIALTKILKQLSGNIKQIDKLGQNSRLKAEQFNWENIANKYPELFKTI